MENNPIRLRKVGIPSQPLAAALLCCAMRALADHPAISESYFFEELPVTLSATRLAQPLADIPTAITILDKEMIKASGAMSIPDLLRLVPGFTVGFYAGSRATASYHGLADQYARDMQVLIDGRSVYDPGYGGVSWTDMPINMDDINRIEVIRGPNATAYGSNAYAGVINIITDHPADAYGNKVITTLGESNKKRIYGRHAKQVGDFSYKLSASYDKGDGFNNREDSYDAKWFSFHGDEQIDSDNQVHLTMGASRGANQEGYSDVLQQVRQLNNNYQFEQIKWMHEESDTNRFQLQFYHNFQDIDDTYVSPRLSDMINALDELQAIPENLRLDFFAVQMGAANYNDFLNTLNIDNGRFIISWLGLSSHRYDLEFEQTLKPSEALRFAWGAGLRRDEAKSLQIFHQYDSRSRNQARLFANSEWHANKDVVFNLGGMLEDYENQSPLFSYRAAANYHMNEENTLRINSSRAFRMPTLYEEYVNFAIFMDQPLNDINTWIKTQDALDPQSIDSIELGYNGQFPDLGLTLDIKLFKEKYRDMIVSYRDYDYPDPTRGLADTTVIDNFNSRIQQGVETFKNGGSADINGIELNLHIKPSHRDLVFVGCSYLDAKGTDIRRKSSGETVYQNNVGTRVPSHTYSLLASHRFDSGYQISGVYYYTGAMTWTGEGDSVPSYSRWDARLGKTLKLAGNDAEIALLVQNLNRKNLDFYNNDTYMNVWERRAYLQFALEF
jgi:iron complex outermembrane recepter protein